MDTTQRNLCGTIVVVGVLLHCCGCSSFHQSSRNHNCHEGLTLVLPGVEGEGLLSNNVARALDDSHLPGAIEVHDWTTGNPIRSLQHLMNGEQSQFEANRLANRIVDYRSASPGGPINLVGHSGGAGIIAMALSRLPKDCHANKVILLAPAISPDFEVQNALTNCESLWCFHSPFDIQLTAGTSIFGTIDRRFSKSAGATGFNDDFPDDNLYQIQFESSMILDGNLGGHLGTTTYRFVKTRIAPILLEE